MKKLTQFIKVTIQEFLNENADEERQGIGNFLKTDDYNIVIKKLPNYLINVHDSAVNYWEDTQDFFHYEKEELDENKTLFSTQKYVSKSFIDSIDKDIHSKGDIILCEDKNSNLWILDGHHRLIYDRMNLKNSFVYIIPFDDVKEIDYLFYGSDDDKQSF